MSFTSLKKCFEFPIKLNVFTLQELSPAVDSPTNLYLVSLFIFQGRRSLPEQLFGLVMTVIKFQFVAWGFNFIWLRSELCYILQKNAACSLHYVCQLDDLCCSLLGRADFTDSLISALGKQK